jgi:hypothetical protein
MVPAFPAVYGGALQMFGRAYRGGPSQDLANRMKAAQQLVFGEQIGWFGPEVLGRPESGKFLRDCIGLRWQLREYFYRGRMVRPVKLMGQIPTVTADWQWHNQWPITTDALLTGAWQLPQEDKVVLLFANVSDDGVSFRPVWEPREYGFTDSSFTVATITAGEARRWRREAAAETEMQLAPRSVVALEFTQPNNPGTP